MRGILAAAALVASGVACSGPAEIPEPIISSVEIDGRPSAVAFAAGSVWVADDENDLIHVVHPESLKVVRTVEVGANPVGLAVDGDSIWVVCASGEIHEIPASGGEPAKVAEIEANPAGVAASDGRVVVTDVVKGVYDLGEERWIEVEAGAVRPLFADGSLWVSGDDAVVTRVGSTDGDHVEVFEAGTAPIGLAYDGEAVWVANSEDDTLSTVAGESRRVVSVGSAPVAVAVSNGSVWSADQDSGTVTQVMEDNETRSIDVPTAPRGITAGLGRIWVVGTNDDVLVSVDPRKGR